jgi:hypothetical protein
MRLALIITFRVAMLVAGVSLAYLLFIFGHTETELTPHSRVLEVAALGGLSALIAGILQWVGLPADGTAQPAPKHGKKKSAK